MDRRHARLRFALLIGVFLLALFPNSGTPSVAAPRATGNIVASEHGEAWPARGRAVAAASGQRTSGADSGATADETLLYTSDAIAADQLFDRIGLHWIPVRGAEDSLFIEVRTSADGRTWGEWLQVREEEDMADEETNERYAAPMPVAPSRYAQYRVFLTSGDEADLGRLTLTFMDVNDLNAGPVARLFNDIAGAFTDFTRSYALAAPVGASKILTRQDWAADESLMRWVPRYQKVQKFVIHHTVTDDGGTNVPASIRSIYYFHAVTRKWGDIGYNYIVDKYGNIWTGRQGGDHVIAGHAYGWNNGTIGVAALGDYSVAWPSSAMQGGIANIIAMKSAQLGIQPFGADPYTHQEQTSSGAWVDVTSSPPNILGHRDCNYVVGKSGGQTACPGNGIYNMLDGLRRLAQNGVNNGYTDLPYLEPAMPRGSYPGAVLNVPVTVFNRGKVAIPAGTRVSYRILKGATTVVAQGGAGTLATQLLPGQSATVAVSLVVPAIGSYVVRWDLQTSANQWWNTVKLTPVRDLWLTSADWSADWVNDNVPRTWTAGETKPITVTVSNDGGRTWPSAGTNPVRLGYKWVSASTGNTFPGPNRVSLPRDILPGQSVSLTIPVTGPVYPTSYTLTLDLYKENEFAFSDKGIAPDETAVGVATDFKATYAIAAVPPLGAGQTVTVPVTITNTGAGVLPTTSSYPVTLGYHWYTAAGQTVVWDSARTKLPADLAPGQSVTLQAQVTAPPQGGLYQLRFDLVQEGVAWFSTKGVTPGTVTVNVAGPVVRAYGATYAPAMQPLGLNGASTTVAMTLKNTGNWTWPAAGANPVTLSYHWADSAGRTVVWDGLRTKLAADVAPGASVTLQAALQYPAAAGTYTVRWDLVEEGVSWFSGKGVPTFDVPLTVGTTATMAYGGSLDVSATPASMAAGATTFYTIRVQNLSNFVWGSNVNLSYHWYGAAGNVVVWDGVRTSLAGMVPNEVRAVQVKVAVPASTGAYTLRYDIVHEGVAWFSSKGMQTPTRPVNVVVGERAAVYAPGAASVAGAAGATVTVPVTLTNVGSLTWQPGAVNLSYHLYTSAGVVRVWDGVRTALPSAVGRGQSVTVNMNVLLPSTAGAYEVRIDLVQEGVTWFSGQGIAPGSVALQVQ